MTEKVSQRKREANRHNAKSSTGPRDTTATRFNAVTHGIFSKEALVVVGGVYEDEEVFEELSSSLWRDLAPVGALEELLVDELIMLTWRRRRVLRHETRAISQQIGLRVNSLEHINNKLDQIATQTGHIDQELSALDEEDPLEARPGLWTRVFEIAEELYGVPITELLRLKDRWDPYDDYSRGEIQQVIEDACRRREVSAKGFWNVVKVQIRLEQILLTPGPTRPHLNLDEQFKLIGLPDKEILDQVQRYEGHLSGLTYKALEKLQRLQAARLGSL